MWNHKDFWRHWNLRNPNFCVPQQENLHPVFGVRISRFMKKKISKKLAIFPHKNGNRQSFVSRFAQNCQFRIQKSLLSSQKVVKSKPNINERLRKLWIQVPSEPPGSSWNRRGNPTWNSGDMIDFTTSAMNSALNSRVPLKIDMFL